jgi:hypothetical protein
MFCAAQWVRRRLSTFRDLALHDQKMALSVLAFEKILSLGEQNCTGNKATPNNDDRRWTQGPEPQTLRFIES